MAKGKHRAYERVELPEWFTGGHKMWMLLYKDEPLIKIAGYDTNMKVIEVMNRGPGQSRGGAHVFIEFSEGSSGNPDPGADDAE